MSTARIEAIRKARSLNDLLTIVGQIEKEYKKNEGAVAELAESISNEEIVMDGRNRNPSTVKVVKYVAPKPAELKKHWAVINSMYDSIMELDAAEAVMKQSFAGNKKTPAALKALRDLKADVNEKLNHAFDAINNIADKHIPYEMQKMSDKVISFLIDHLNPKSYKNMYRQVYVAPVDKAMHFSVYVTVEGLKTESGFVFDQYNFVLTGVVGQDGTIEYFLTSIPDFKSPGRFPLGKQVTSIPDAQKRVDILLAHNDFLLTNDKLPLPFDEERAKTSGMTNLKNVENVAIKNDDIIVTMSPEVKTDKVLENAIIDVMARLNGLIGGNARNKTLFTYKVATRGGKKVVTFSLVANVAGKDKPLLINNEKLADVKQLLNLTDKQVEALKFAIQH